MSTAHNGKYCTFRDKMVLTRDDALAMAKRMGGMDVYHCQHCKGYHLYTGSGTQRVGKNRKRNRNHVVHLGSEPDIFEVRTSTYNPDKMVPAVPPKDYTGKLVDWANALRRMGLHVDLGIPMIRAADYARIVANTEP